ncbi:hypothetical protein HQQ80_19085 [Microbacteriaceae bacterium VKM Ac-2855]|nr:hypothetical protein [Microbacteriaceae bacterium VKM Ac-2855]
MKTLSHIGGNILLPDDTADSVLRYALVLARSGSTDTVVLDGGDAGSLTLMIGVGVPLALQDDRLLVHDAFGSSRELERRILAARIPRAEYFELGTEQDLDFLDLTGW